MNKLFLILTIAIHVLLTLYPSILRGETLTVKNFYGQTIILNFPNELHQIKPHTNFYEPDYGSDIDRWTEIAKPLAKSIMKAKKTFQLSDWHALLLSSRSAKEANINENSIVLCVLATLRATNINATIILYKKRTSLAVATESQVYNASFLRLADSIFLIYDALDNKFLSIENEKAHVFDAEKRLSIKASKKLNLIDIKEPSLPFLPIKKKLTWRFKKSIYTLNVTFNKNLLNYLRDYPQLGVEFYFRRPSSTSLKKKVFGPIKRIIEKEKFSERDALNFILNFCLALPYREDNKTSYGERCNFPEETIFAMYSDCEDRSALLSAMVWETMSLPSVGLRYKSHISVGMKVTKLLDKDQKFIAEDGSIYIPCDPSFFNSQAGDANNIVAGKVPIIIKTKHH